MFMSKAFCFINTLEIVYCTTEASIFPVSISNTNPCTDCKSRTADAKVQNTSGWFLFRADTRPDTLKDLYMISVCHFVSAPWFFFHYVGVFMFITVPNQIIVEYLMIIMHVLCFIKTTIEILK